jgi:hypothetical protein
MNRSISAVCAGRDSRNDSTKNEGIVVRLKVLLTLPRCDVNFARWCPKGFESDFLAGVAFMAKNKDTQEIFKRCHNSQEVPESMCVFCFHTFVAPTMELLEQLEQEHVCWEKPAPTNRWGLPTYSA